MSKKKGLGRKGLELLLSSVSLQDVPVKGGDFFDASESGSSDETPVVLERKSSVRASLDRVAFLPIEKLRRGRFQPRRNISEDSLQDLVVSIKQQGVMQPIIVREIGIDGLSSFQKETHESEYEIIAGERRWRAAQLAGLERIPCLIREVDDQVALAMALVENMQREDLNPIEEAFGLNRLQQEFDLTHQEISEVIGISRSAVTNLLRLINLADDVKKMLEENQIEMGHARALLSLSLENQIKVANFIVDRGLSVRQAESYVKELLTDGAKKTKGNSQPKDINILKLQDDLSEKVGASVRIVHASSGKGKLVIKYESLDELDGILARIH